MAITPKNRSVEMGRVILAPALQKTRAATEAQYLVMTYVFDVLNYRRMNGNVIVSTVLLLMQHSD